MKHTEYIAHLQKAIRAVHGCESAHSQTVRVREEHQGKTVWEGDVEVFKLSGHPKAQCCYAWAYDNDKGSKVLAVLELPPVISPVTAVRAAIMAETSHERK